MATYEETQTAAYLLKQHTAQNHQALEALVEPQLHALKSQAEYETFLKKFWGFFKPVEEVIARHIDARILPDIAERRSAHRILDDLSFSNTHAALPEVATHLPTITTAAEAFGALYVLEGSTLGGRGITRMLLKNSNLQLQPAQVQFFNGYGENTGVMWMGFLKTLNNYAANSAVTTQMIAAANDTFASFKNWLQK